MTVAKRKRLTKTMNSLKNGMEIGRPCSKNVTKSSLKVSLGPTRNSASRRPYGQMKITVNHLWRINTKSCGLVRNGNVREKHVQTSDYLAKMLAPMTFRSQGASEIATSLRPWLSF
jgi:hypothetical protein